MKRHTNSDQEAWSPWLSRARRHWRDDRLDEALAREPNVYGQFFR